MGKTSRNISKGATNAFDWGCWACCAVRIMIASPPSCQPCAMHVIRDINWSVCTSPFLTFPTLNLTIRYIMKILPYRTLIASNIKFRKYSFIRSHFTSTSK